LPDFDRADDRSGSDSAVPRRFLVSPVHLSEQTFAEIAPGDIQSVVRNGSACVTSIEYGNFSASMASQSGNVMKLPRRAFFYVTVSAAALPAMSQIAWAQTYPSRPIRIMVGFPPGGPSDILARLIGQRLSERLAQPFIIENRPGAQGQIATEAVTRAPADGHTLLLVVPGNGIANVLYDKLNFNFMRDTTPVAGISNGPLVMEVNPAIPVHTVPEFIAYTKARPGKVNFASPGNGSTIQLCGELFKIMTGVDMVHVPYRGNAPALTDLITGQMQVMFADTPSSIEHVKAGKLRALAVTTAERLGFCRRCRAYLPGFEASNWFGVAAPKNTLPEIVDKLNKEINVALAEPDMKARLADLGAAALAGSPAHFGKFIAAEAEKWSKVIRTANIKVD
jgi:tripartite-type tricarboxylate transporter receptor subunit TctC